MQYFNRWRAPCQVPGELLLLALRTALARISVWAPDFWQFDHKPPARDPPKRSFSFGRRLMVPPSSNSAPPEKPKTGKPLLFSNFLQRPFGPPSPSLPDFAGVTDLLLPSSHLQRTTSDHSLEQPPCQMARDEHPPVVPRVLDQPAAGLHLPLLQASQGPVPDLPRPLCRMNGLRTRSWHLSEAAHNEAL